MNDTEFEQLIGGVNEVIAHLEGKQTLRSVWPEIPHAAEIQNLASTIVGRMFAGISR